jgi:hypothetical protein
LVPFGADRHQKISFTPPRLGVPLLNRWVSVQSCRSPNWALLAVVASLASCPWHPSKLLPGIGQGADGRNLRILWICFIMFLIFLIHDKTW